MKVIVVGLGAMGAATAWQLAEAGHDVIGIDKHHPPHDWGSTHGHSRVTRVAYHEDPVYVPMAMRAQGMWRRLEQQSGQSLMHITGALLIGPPDGEVVPGLRQAAAMHHLELDDPGVEAIRRRWPHLEIPPGFDALVEPAGGIIDPEAAVEAMLHAARTAGADIRTGVEMTSWQADGERARVETSDGRIDADALVLAAGPWASDALPNLPVTVTRQVQHWFRPSTHYHADRFPVFLVEDTDGSIFYGIPDRGDDIGAKIALHHGSHDATTPGDVQRAVGPEEVEAIQAKASAFLPGITDRHRGSSVCLYSNSPDQHFIIDTLPDAANVVVLAGFSGHGFKFAPVVGEMATGLLTGNIGYRDVPFGLRRFAGA